jgi:hypothetical protein
MNQERYRPGHSNELPSPKKFMIGFAIFAAISLALLFLTEHPPWQRKNFGGYSCTIDCSGHIAGYEWAEKHSVTVEDECPAGNSRSFREGCLAIVNRGEFCQLILLPAIVSAMLLLAAALRSRSSQR